MYIVYKYMYVCKLCYPVVIAYIVYVYVSI